MIRKFTHYLLMGAIWCSVVSCNDDEVSTPPKPAFQANKSSAEVGDEITFTINKVNAKAISLLPYGLPGGDEGILVTNFNDGVATVNFSYARPGTFQAIVVANNHSGDGESVKNVQSDPITITITSSKNSITAFGFDKVDAKTTIDQDAKTINVIVPYGTDVTKLKATFTASGFSTVTVNGAAQKSGETENNFSSPKVYTVTANNGTTNNYTVTVAVTPIETINTIKSITAKAVSKSAKDKALPASVDNTARTIVIYDTLGTSSEQFDSVRVGYALNGKFAILKYGGKVMKQDSLLNLTSMKQFQVFPQDSATSGSVTYNVYAVAAPKLGISFPDLNPDPASGVKPTNFDITVNALKGTDLTSIKTVTTITSAAGVTATVTKVDDAVFANGSDVDYSSPAKFELTVVDANLGVTYKVIYTVTVTVVP